MNIGQERADFEAWYQQHHCRRNMYERDAYGEYADKQVQGAFNVWLARAALQSQDRGDTKARAMAFVADQYAHVMAMHLECILFNYTGPFSDEAMQTLSKYRDAMNKIHEPESPKHIGEPLLNHPRQGEGG